MLKPLSQVWIQNDVVSGIRRDAEHYCPLESGGILLGYLAGNEAVVTAWADGGPLAVRKRESFIPDQEYQIKSIATIYEKYRRQITYIGDWHSHPHGPFVPSSRDKRTLRNIAQFREARIPTPVMLIVGVREDFSAAAWSVHACGWRWRYYNVPTRLFFARALTLRG